MKNGNKHSFDLHYYRERELAGQGSTEVERIHAARLPLPVERKDFVCDPRINVKWPENRFRVRIGDNEGPMA